VESVHSAFFGNSITNVHIFVAGVGLIGSAFLEQLKEQASTLLIDQGINLKVVGLSRSSRSLVDRLGIDLHHWGSLLENSQGTGIESFVKSMVSMDFPNCVFVDCSASEKVTDFYEEILQKVKKNDKMIKRVKKW
jgi:aspartokinase/homoserine dehydrogenase 1